MKYVLITIISMVFSIQGYAIPQTNVSQENTHFNRTHDVTDSIHVDEVTDSFLMAMNNREYERAYSFVYELEMRDTLSSTILYYCADCMIYLDKYQECLDFCDKWEHKYPDNGYDSLFSPLRGECHYYMKDYERAGYYLSYYNDLLKNSNERMSVYYCGIYATVLHNLYKYDEANIVYDAYFSDLLEEEGLHISNSYLSKHKDNIGSKLYDYAFNNFFLGDEKKGMELLYIASKCGDEWAQGDYAHLSKCKTVMMDLDLKNKILNEFAKYLEKYDFKYVRDSSSDINVAEDFWEKVVDSNAPVVELQTEMNRPKKNKILQRAITELSNERPNIMSYLSDNCTPFSPEGLEYDLSKRLSGNDAMVVNDFRIYPAEEKNAFATPYGQIYLTSSLVMHYHFNKNLLLGVCAHEMTHSKCFHSLTCLWKQYEKERKNKIIAGVVSGVTAAAMTGAAMYAAGNGVSYDQSYYDDIAVTTTDLYNAIEGSSFYFQFKYSRWQEIEADLIAYRFCEAIGLGGYSYIMALQLLNDTDFYVKADKTDNHPTISYRIAFLKWIYANENHQ